MFFAALDYRDINMALNKPAVQCSTYQNVGPNLAVDGNQGTLSCTLGQVHPWWAVDLGTQYDVSHVIVMNDLNVGAGKLSTNLPYQRTVAQSAVTEYSKFHRDYSHFLHIGVWYTVLAT